MPIFFLRRLPGRSLWLLLGSLLLAGWAWAQSAPIIFGQIDPKDLTAAPFVADSAAEAVVLCDYGSTSIVNESRERHQLRFDRITRIKILKKSGFDWATVEEVLRRDTEGHQEQLLSLRGCTYNLVDGRVISTPLAEGGDFNEKVSDLHSVRRFTLPQVREGSVIEFSYSILSDYIVNFRSWQFQRSIPVRWSEYRAHIPMQYTYKMFVQHSQPLAVEEQKGANTNVTHFRWAMRDVPALHLESYMTAAADYVDELRFELANYYSADISRSWAQIDSYIIEDRELGRQLDQHGFLKADLARLPAPTATNARERVAAVHNLVTSAVRCTQQPELLASASLRKIYQETHRGNVADVNYLLVAALRGAGYAANPVLLSTRSHGRIRTNLPQISQFNYVAAHVRLPDGEQLVLDATNPLLPFDMLPERCLNQRGRLVRSRPDTSCWIDIRPRYRRLHLQQVQLELAADGSLRGQVHEELAGYAGAAARGELLRGGDKKYAAQLSNQHPGWLIPDLRVSNRDSLSRPLALDYRFTQAAEAAQPVATIYLSPLREFGPGRNPFPAEGRAYPADFGMAQEETLVVSLTLPPGYELASLPASQALDLPDQGGRFTCSATRSGSIVQLTSRLVLRKPLYGAAEFGSLRELYRRLLEKQAEKLVIQKKA